MKKHHKTLFSELYSPYMSEEKNDSTAWYEEYKRDTEKSIIIDGKTYYKIIYRFKYNRNNDFSWMVLVYIPEDYRIGDMLVDENGNEFIIKAVEMMTYTTIPEWYPIMFPLCIVGKTNDIGIYFAKKTQPNRYYDGHYIESNFTLDEHFTYIKYHEADKELSFRDASHLKSNAFSEEQVNTLNSLYTLITSV